MSLRSANEHDTSLVEQYEPVFVARQPVYDRQTGVWGYELLFRHSAEARTAQVSSEDEATAKVIVDGFSLAMAGVPQGKRTLINFPRKLLVNGTAFALPKDICVVEILETVEPDDEVIAACKELKKAGYTLALDDFVGDSGYEPLLELADLVKVDLLNMAPPKVMAVTKPLKARGVDLLAEKVEDKKTLQLTKTLGYALFQGYYFSRPDIISGRTLPVGAMARVRLLQELSREDYNVKTLSRIISTDTSLSYRLLRYINSVAFAFQSKVTSISQAVALLGARPLKQWLMVVVISDMVSNPRSYEQAALSVQRGRFLETMYAEASSKPQVDGESMFLLGLFSRLDAMLCQPMEELLKEMPLDDSIRTALLGEKTVVSPWLNLVEMLSEGRWEEAESILESIGVSQQLAAREYSRAALWAQDVLGSSKKKAAKPAPA